MRQGYFFTGAMSIGSWSVKLGGAVRKGVIGTGGMGLDLALPESWGIEVAEMC